MSDLYAIFITVILSTGLYVSHIRRISRGGVLDAQRNSF
jgi:hypothetical protein